jgi:thiol-disulfide isomerase/thioredoxin
MKPGQWLAALCWLPMLAAAEAPSPTPLFAATLTDTEDKPVALAQYKGRPLVINFWARWCGPCRDEIPHLISERTRLNKQGLEVIGIAIEDKAEPVRDFAKAYDIDYPVLIAKDQGIPLMQALGNSRAGLPYTLVLDREGKVITSKLGAMTKDEMKAAFSAAIVGGGH